MSNAATLSSNVLPMLVSVPDRPAAFQINVKPTAAFEGRTVAPSIELTDFGRRAIYSL